MAPPPGPAEVELLPCPFCGALPFMANSPVGMCLPNAACMECGATGPVAKERGDATEATRLWNTRAPSHPTSPPREPTEEMIASTKSALFAWFEGHTGFDTRDGEDSVLAYYGNHWVGLNLDDLARHLCAAAAPKAQTHSMPGEVRAAMKRLVNEVRALSPFEDEVRAAISNTNWACLLDAVFRAESALASLSPDQVNHDRHDQP